MNCITFQKGLEDYLQDGLDFAGRFALERHAQQCFSCGKVMEDAQKLSQMARQLKRVKAPANFEASLLGKIHEQNLDRRRRHFWQDWWYWLELPRLRTSALYAASLLIITAGIAIPVYLANRNRQQALPFADARPAANPALDNRSAISRPDQEDSVAAAESPEPIEMRTPVKPASNRVRARYSTEPERLGTYAEPAGSDYVEYLVPGPGERQMIVRLPRTIRMRYGPPSEEHFIRNVSH